MPLLQIAEYRLAQDRSTGFVALKLVNPDGSIFDPFNGQWRAIPFAAFSSLVGILTSGSSAYDPQKDLYVVTHSRTQYLTSAMHGIAELGTKGSINRLKRTTIKRKNNKS